MVFYRGEFGLRDPRIHSLSGGASGGNKQHSEDGYRMLFVSPRLLRQDGRNQILQRNYCTWVPHAIARYIKNRTLHTVRQQKPGTAFAFSSPCHACGLNLLDSYEVLMQRTAIRTIAAKIICFSGHPAPVQLRSALLYSATRYTRPMDRLCTPWRYSYITGADPQSRSGVPAALSAWP